MSLVVMAVALCEILLLFKYSTKANQLASESNDIAREANAIAANVTRLAQDAVLVSTRLANNLGDVCILLLLIWAVLMVVGYTQLMERRGHNDAVRKHAT
jgi:beta-lactamase regulating signal transducer with metallopeptidase domain